MTLTLSVTLDVPDLARGSAFYGAVFGFAEIARPHPAYAILKAGTATLCLMAKPEGSRPTPEDGPLRSYARHWTPAHLDFHVTDYAACLAAIRDHGGRIEAEHAREGRPPVAFCADPFGHGFCVLGDNGAVADAPGPTPGFIVRRHIGRPVRAVYEAIADPAQLRLHFATGGAEGRPEVDRVLRWSFLDDPGEIRVDVVACAPPGRLVLRWTSEDGSRTTITIALKEEEGGTSVSIAEDGWPPTPIGLETSYGNCEGWTAMLAGLKAWLEHGVVLRTGGRPEEQALQ